MKSNSTVNLLIVFMRISSHSVTLENRSTRLERVTRNNQEKRAILKKCLESLFLEAGIRSYKVKPWEYPQQKHSRPLRQPFSSKQPGDCLTESPKHCQPAFMRELRAQSSTSSTASFFSVKNRGNKISPGLNIYITWDQHSLQWPSERLTPAGTHPSVSYSIIQSHFYKFMPNLISDLPPSEPRSLAAKAVPFLAHGQIFSGFLGNN